MSSGNFPERLTKISMQQLLEAESAQSGFEHFHAVTSKPMGEKYISLKEHTALMQENEEKLKAACDALQACLEELEHASKNNKTPSSGGVNFIKETLAKIRGNK